MSPRFLWLLAATTITLTACSSQTADLEDFVAGLKQRDPVQPAPIPAIKTFAAFQYQAEGKKDPFAAAAQEKRTAKSGGSGAGPNLDRNKEPLEEFPLDALRMLGIIESGGKMFALIKAPDGIVHRVTNSNHLGQNYGEIVGITEAEVSIKEFVLDSLDDWTERPASLSLAQ